MNRLLAIAALTLGLTGVVLAHDGDTNHEYSAPEINPQSASGAMALIGGALLVLRGRK